MSRSRSQQSQRERKRRRPARRQHAALGRERQPSGEVPIPTLTMVVPPVGCSISDPTRYLAKLPPGRLSDALVALMGPYIPWPPAPDELAMLVRFYKAQRTRFASKALDPAAVAGAGEGDVGERAAWTTLARSLLNLDEVITKR